MNTFDWKNHVRLWLWLGHIPDREKNEWWGWKYWPDQAGYFCFACNSLEEGVPCKRGKRCPLNWGLPQFCMAKGSLYRQRNWWLADRAEVSLAIADLPLSIYAQRQEAAGKLRIIYPNLRRFNTAYAWLLAGYSIRRAWWPPEKRIFLDYPSVRLKKITSDSIFLATKDGDKWVGQKDDFAQCDWEKYEHPSGQY